MWAPLSLCLLPALLATGSALLCEVCESKEESCSSPLQPCAPSEGNCVTSVAAFDLGESYFIYTAKSCLETKSCEPSSFTVTFPRNFTMRLNVSCCDTDGCNAGAIPVPSVSHVPNGRQCPACYAPGADRCEAMELLPCTGAQDHCVDVAGTLIAGNFTLKKAAAGCGSLGACIAKVGERKYAKDVVDVLTRAECYPALRAGGEL